MRKINLIVIHCSATKEGCDIGVSEIRRMHIARHFVNVGYHFVIRLDGTIEKGRPVPERGAHAKGYNENSIGICYIGGVDSNGKSKDTRTPEQKDSLSKLITKLKESFPKARVVGHRDLSPDLNGDGIVEPREFVKDCPCFEVQKEYE